MCFKLHRGGLLTNMQITKIMTNAAAKGSAMIEKNSPVGME